MSASDLVCRCGHSFDAHQHLRKGTDCALCGRGGCSRFESAASRPLVARLASFVRARLHVGSVVTHPTARRSAERFRDVQPGTTDDDLPKEA